MTNKVATLKLENAYGGMVRYSVSVGGREIAIYGGQRLGKMAATEEGARFGRIMASHEVNDFVTEDLIKDTSTAMTLTFGIDIAMIRNI